jgi:hypothetical protein
MPSFCDTDGQSWDVRITIGLREKIKSRCKFDFVDERNKGFLQLVESLYELDRVVDVIEVICAGQLAERKMTIQQLFDKIDGNALDAAQLALVEGFEDFFRQTRRGHLATTLREIWTGWTKVELTAEQSVQALVEKGISQTLTELSGKSRELSASTPAI